MQDCALNSLVRWGHWFCSTYGESHRLCFLFKCHCKQVFWMEYAACYVLWFGCLVWRAEDCIQQWLGYELLSLPREEQAPALERHSVYGLDWRWPVLQVPWPNRVIRFALQTIISAYCTLCWAVQIFMCSGQPFWSGRAGIFTQQ